MDLNSDLTGQIAQAQKDREDAADMEAGLALERSASGAPKDAAAMTHTASASGAPNQGMWPSIGRFAMELPGRSIYGGGHAAVQGFVQSTYETAKWLQENEPAVTKAMERGETTLAEQEKPQGEAAVESPLQVPAKPPEPTTQAGDIVKGITHFMAGYAITNALMPGLGLADTPRALLVGAITQAVDFDPGQQRLSNLVQKFPALQNPVTEYLQTSPNDPRALGRLKAAVEGMGLGIAQNALFAGVKLVKAGMDRMYAGGAPEIEGRVLPPAEGMPVKPGDLSPLTDGKAPLTTVVSLEDVAKSKIEQAAGASPGGTAAISPGQLIDGGGGRGMYINLNKIGSPDDVKDIIQNAADLQSLSIKEAQRGIQSHAATQDLADKMGIGVNEILMRNQGQPYNAEYSVAARKVWAASGENLTAMAQRASSPTASVVDQFNFRRALAVHAAIQNEVIGARTETARALNAWKIPVGSGEEQAKGIQALMEQAGGALPTQKFAAAIAQASEAGTLNEQGVALLARKGWGATSADAFNKLYQFSLLSGPHSMAVKTLGDAYIAATTPIERAIAGQVSKILPGPGVATDEGSQYLFGMAQGARDVFRWVSKTLRGEDAGDLLPAGRLTQAHEMAGAPPISAQAFGADMGHVIDAETGERVQSMWGAMLDSAGAVTSIPGKGFEGITNAFKALHYRGELYAQAARQASYEVGKVPASDPAAWTKNRIADLIANPTDEALSTATDTALHNTMSDPAGTWAKLGMDAQKALDSTGVPLGHTILPFIKTPVNIMGYQLERTPLAVAQQAVRDDILAGGARRALALTRIGTGTAAMLTIMDMTMNGLVTGGGHPNRSTEMAREREDILPYSVKIGDRWLKMSRAEPLGGTIGMAADIAEFLKWKGETDTDDMPARTLIAAGIVALSGNVMDKAYLTGLANTVDAIHDPARFGPKYMKQLAGSMVPAAATSIKQADDPTVRATYDMLDAIKARTPGWSKDLPPSRNLWGDARTGDSGLGWGYDMFSPLASKQEKPTAIDDEIRRLGASVTMPSSKVSFSGIPLDMTNWPKLYDKYITDAGNGLKNEDGLGAKDYLNRLVSGKADESEMYKEASDGPDGGKAMMIQGVIGKYRAAAREKLLQDSPELQQELIRLAVKKGADPGDIRQ